MGSVSSAMLPSPCLIESTTAVLAAASFVLDAPARFLSLGLLFPASLLNHALAPHQYAEIYLGFSSPATHLCNYTLNDLDPVNA